MVAPRGNRAAALAGLQRSLPVTLIVTFFFVPSTATRIFKTFQCDQIEYSGGTPPATRRYLQDDLTVDCDSPDYQNHTFDTAVVLVMIWPLGVPLLYALLLFANRHAISTRTETPMRQAIAFLTEDYEVAAFWWEPLEMCAAPTIPRAAGPSDNPTIRPSDHPTTRQFHQLHA